MNNEALSIAQSIGFPGTTWEQFREWAWEEHGVTVYDIELKPHSNSFFGKITYGSHYWSRTPMVGSEAEAKKRTVIILAYFLRNDKQIICKSCGADAEVLHEGYCEGCYNNLIGMT